MLVLRVTALLLVYLIAVLILSYAVKGLDLLIRHLLSKRHLPSTAGKGHFARGNKRDANPVAVRTDEALDLLRQIYQDNWYDQDSHSEHKTCHWCWQVEGRGHEAGCIVYQLQQLAAREGWTRTP